MCRKPKIRAAIIRRGFGGPLYYNHNKEPQMVLVIISALHITLNLPVLLRKCRKQRARRGRGRRGGGGGNRSPSSALETLNPKPETRDPKP